MRRSSREVRIGGVVIGGSREPVVQSMTSTPTTDVDATLSQAIRLHEQGARLVRLAVPDNRSLKALASLKQKMAIRDIVFPIIADIHFSLKLALDALREVEKLRVNPGNLLDIPRGRAGNGGATQIDQRTREQALERLLSAAKVAGKAVRIGVNQGSLSKRIVERYGNGPEAMVESAMEYITMARENSFFDLVISLKSSDPWSIVAAHSLLDTRGVEFPFHVGVTEAGWGLQGRARSAAGIGSLLRRGLVDTLRVSLAEPPEKELPVAKALIKASRPIIVVDSSRERGKVHGVQVACSEGNGVVGEVRTRIVSAAGSFISDPDTPGESFGVVDLYDHYQDVPDEAFIARVVGNPDSPSELSRWIKDRILVRALEKKVMGVQLPLPGWGTGGEESLTSVLKDLRTSLIWETGFSDEAELMLAVSDLAQLFEAGFLQVLELRTGNDPDADRDFALDILQGLGTGQWRADLIACPQCGRCRVNVSSLIREVRARLGHIPGIKLAVMGCVVNGPGEMEDADFGCVGEGEGKVSFYEHGECLERGISLKVAADRFEEFVNSALSRKEKETAPWRWSRLESR